MGDKIKIRKVEAAVEDVFSRMEKLIMVSEQAKPGIYGITIDLMSRTLGIKELELYEIIFDNEEAFDYMFILLTHPNTEKIKKIVLKSSWHSRANNVSY